MALALHRDVAGGISNEIRKVLSPLQYTYDIFLTLSDVDGFAKGTATLTLTTTKVFKSTSNFKARSVVVSSSEQATLWVGEGGALTGGSCFVSTNLPQSGRPDCHIQTLAMWDRILNPTEMEQVLKLGDSNVAKGSLLLHIENGVNLMPKKFNKHIRIIEEDVDFRIQKIQNQSETRFFRGLNQKFLVIIVAAYKKLTSLLGSL